MNCRIALLVSIFTVASAAVLAQPQTNKPAAVRWIVGETGCCDLGVRPRTVRRLVSTWTNSTAAASVVSSELRTFALINRKRSEAGLKPLVWSETLAAIARSHSVDMAKRGYFDHRSQSGKRVADRAADAHLGEWRAIGENIAANRGYADPISRAVEGWQLSSLHKRNFLTESWTESAIGMAVASDGTYYFTQVFLKR